MYSTVYHITYVYKLDTIMYNYNFGGNIGFLPENYLSLQARNNNGQPQLILLM
jgi:hypothetical protein